MQRVAIIGGGFAGVAAAHTFVKSLRPGEAEIHVFESQGAHGYTPLFCETAAAGMERGLERAWAWNGSALPFTASGVWNALDAVVLHREEVVHMDVLKKAVRLKDGDEFLFDTVILAAGAGNTLHKIEGASACALPLKHLEDVAAIQRKMSELSVRGGLAHVVVIGGGAVALEFAAQVAWRAKREHDGRTLWKVTVLDGGKRVLAQAPMRASRLAEKRLAQLGVVVEGEKRAWRIEEGKVFVRDASGVSREVHADVLVWACGVAPRPQWSEWGLPVDSAGWVCVDEHFQVEGVPGVYAAGDMIVQGGAQTPKRAPAALAQGEAAARAAMRAWRGQAPRRSAFFARVRSWPFAVPLGGRVGVVSWGPFAIGGFVGWVIRALADAQYFFTVLTVREAWRRWRYGAQARMRTDKE